MMRRLYNIGILLSVLFISLIACNKDKESTMMPNTESEVYWSEDDVKTQNQILDFQDKIKNNSFKDGEMMSVDDALWNLEALINFNYSTPDSGFLNLTIDTTFEANVMINNGMVSYNNLVDVALGMEEYVVNFTNQLPSDIRFMIAADVTLKESSLKDGSSIVEVTAAFGSDKVNINTPCYSPFEDYDFWYFGRAWANDGGYCDGPHAGTNLSSDAAEQIEFKINNPECIQQDIPGTYVVSTATLYVEASYYPNPDDDQVDNSYDCLMFHQSTSVGSVNLCLSPDKMDWYVQGTAKVVQERSLYIKSLHPTENWKFLGVDMVGEHFNFQGNIDYFHRADLMFGKLAFYVPPKG